ncbi:sel1 repeat family protein [Salmonella enterica]|uniref:Sel1 repeat family protein n=30 Tax=Enterobacteriaceae TaxID=543 RepID=A0A5V0NW52_SALER|nr:sel1 repeat family protein [Salmonella enterica]EBS7735392.1 sel1 repeat family protein [Salmonella enterica]EGV2479204.1 sel1 repeat family protein [Salmonella enterica]EHZ5231871.1 sel1 repeat family protein [Salmonella enterica]EIK6072554.1 sel1 repeat family protein [Salmonella enterica]
MEIKYLSLCILAGILFVSQVNASENNGKDDVKYAALTQKDLDALPVEKRASVLDELGFIHEYGIGVPMNRERALQYYKQACELGGNYGCYNVKYAYQYGDGVAKDSAQANKYAKKMNLDNLLIEQEYIDKFSQEIYMAKALADTDKSQRAAFISILIHALNNRPESDALFFSRIGFNQEKTFRLATLWSQDGDPQMDYQMGRLTLNDFSGRYADEPYKARPASLKWFRAAAEKGVVEAQSLLGGIYSGGEGDEWGIKPDIQEAQKWYGQAAEQGDSDAQIALGKIYFYAPQSDERKLLSRIGFDSSHLARIAILWAREGDPEVAYQTAKLVSTLYFNNETKTIDIAEALKWLRISAEKGDADSQTLLGFLYEHAGLGLQPDGEKARKWYEMAAQQGNGEALYTLGRMYYSGVMVNVDYDKALYFFKKAYEKELQAAADYLAQMYFNGQSVDVDCQQSWHYYDNSYIKKMTQRDYLDYCEKDRKRRNDFSQQLPELTLEKYAGLFGRIDNIPLCQIGFVVNTNKLIHVANLRVELILKNDAGVSDERMVAFPPLGLNTLGAEQGMGDSFKSMGYLLMKNGDLCDYHKLTFTVKSATATINGKKVDLLKTDNLHIIQNR